MIPIEIEDAEKFLKESVKGLCMIATIIMGNLKLFSLDHFMTSMENV